MIPWSIHSFSCLRYMQSFGVDPFTDLGLAFQVKGDMTIANAETNALMTFHGKYLRLLLLVRLK